MNWSLEASLERGCLPTGEPVEALYGAGWWTEEEQEPELPPIVKCHVCGGQAYLLDEEIDCENCGKIAKEEEQARRGGDGYRSLQGIARTWQFNSAHLHLA